MNLRKKVSNGFEYLFKSLSKKVIKEPTVQKSDKSELDAEYLFDFKLGYNQNGGSGIFLTPTIRNADGSFDRVANSPFMNADGEVGGDVSFETKPKKRQMVKINQLMYYMNWKPCLNLGI